jgi:hypothetical protein
VNVANTIGCVATDDGVSRPPMSPERIRWKVSSAYILAHGSHRDTRRFPQATRRYSVGSSRVEYVSSTSPVSASIVAELPTRRMGAVQPPAPSTICRHRSKPGCEAFSASWPTQGGSEPLLKSPLLMRPQGTHRNLRLLAHRWVTIGYRAMRRPAATSPRSKLETRQLDVGPILGLILTPPKIFLSCTVEPRQDNTSNNRMQEEQICCVVA